MLGRASGARAHFFELVDGHEHRSRFRPFRRTDDAPPFEQIHEPAGAGEPDAELALEHARRSGSRPYDELHRFGEQVVGVILGGPGPAAAWTVAALHAVDVGRLRRLAPPVG